MTIHTDHVSTIAIVAHGCMIAIAAVGAWIDHKSGRIPNWLTFPAAAIAPLLWLMVSADAALTSLGAIFVCGGIPYIMFRMDAIGGGDVKLFAALGGLGGIVLGIEAQMYSLLSAMVFLLIALAVKGELWGILKNTGRMLKNALLPPSKRGDVQSSGLHEFRLGPAILVGTILAIAGEYVRL